MQEWLKVSLLLCTYGLVREIRPSEPYVSEFLLGPWRDISEETLNQDVYPVGTYSYLSQLVVVFLVTDYLKYKPLIVLSSICGIAVYSVLLWTKSLAWLQVSQFFYGLYMATEVAYYTYMYAKVEQDKYEQVSSWSRAAALVGRFISGASAQLLISFSIMDFRQLNYITLSTQILSIVWAVLLPSTERSIYFHRENLPLAQSETSSAPQIGGLRLLWEHTRSSYTRGVVLAWSLWYAASMAGFLQVQSYMQLLWKEIQPDQENLYNGVVEAILTVLGALAALFAGRNPVRSDTRALPAIPAVAALMQAGAVLAAAFASYLWISYLGYIVLGIVYHYMITVTSAIIARHLVYDSCFGLIFGINTLIGVGLQSILTLVVISKKGLELDIRGQYRAYAVCYICLSIIVCITWIAIAIKKRQISRSKD